MDSNYYIEYFPLERNHWWFRARQKILIEHLSSLRLGANTNVLNIGIATGATSEMLEQFGAVKSVEYDKECYDFVKQKLPKLDLDLGSITDLSYPDNSYDLVCAFDVIEHVEDDKKAVSEIIRVCKPEGHVVVTVPAFQYLWGQHDIVNHHYRRYTKKEFKKLFQQGGTISYSAYFNFFLFFPIFFFRISSRILPKGFLRQENKPESDFSVFQPNWFKNVCYKIMLSERFFIRKKITLPFGVSILISFRKNKIY